MSLLKTLLIFLIIASEAIGADATYLKPNEPAPTEGILFTIPKAKQLRLIEVEHDGMKLQIESYKTIIENQTKNQQLDQNKLNILQTQNDKLSEDLTKNSSFNNWERLGYIVLGIALTGVAGYGLHQATK